MDLAVAFRSMMPLTELVNSELLERMSRVNEPLVPTVTSPVMVLVTLLNVFVAPSATTCAGSCRFAQGAEPASIQPKRRVFASAWKSPAEGRNRSTS